MILPDVNVLVIAHRPDQDEHERIRPWLEEAVNSDRPFALADVVAAGFIRIVTNARVFRKPTPVAVATRFVDELVDHPTCVPVAAGPRHWPIFRDVLRASDARGNLVPDAHLAAIAIEHGATVATRDRGFARFAAATWFDPVQSAGA